MINWFLARVPRLFNGEIIFSTNGDGSIGPCGLRLGPCTGAQGWLRKEECIPVNTRSVLQWPMSHTYWLYRKKLEEKITLLSMDLHPWCVIFGGACSTCISNTCLLTRALGSQGDCSHLVSENTYVALKNMDISHVSGVTVHNRLREYKSVT